MLGEEGTHVQADFQQMCFLMAVLLSHQSCSLYCPLECLSGGAQPQDYYTKRSGRKCSVFFQQGDEMFVLPLQQGMMPRLGRTGYPHPCTAWGTRFLVSIQVWLCCFHQLRHPGAKSAFVFIALRAGGCSAL